MKLIQEMFLIKLGCLCVAIHWLLYWLISFSADYAGVFFTRLNHGLHYIYFSFLVISFILTTVGIIFAAKIIWYLKVSLLPSVVVLYLGILMLPYKVTYSTMDSDGKVIQKAMIPHYSELVLVVGTLVFLGSFFWIWKDENSV